MRLLFRQRQKNLFFLLLLLLMPGAAFAGFPLDLVDTNFKKTIFWVSPGWQLINNTTAIALAKSLFWKVVLIDFTLSTIDWVKDRKKMGEMILEYIKKTFTIGFFWLLLVSFFWFLQFAG